VKDSSSLSLLKNGFIFAILQITMPIVTILAGIKTAVAHIGLQIHSGKRFSFT
jgi:hypothetical protein